MKKIFLCLLFMIPAISFAKLTKPMSVTQELNLYRMELNKDFPGAQIQFKSEAQGVDAEVLYWELQTVETALERPELDVQDNRVMYVECCLIVCNGGCGKSFNKEDISDTIPQDFVNSIIIHPAFDNLNISTSSNALSSK